MTRDAIPSTNATGSAPTDSVAVETLDVGVEIDWGDGAIFLPWFWLRDHGEDPASFNPDTKQRRVDTFAIPADIQGVAASVIGDDLVIDWGDDEHPTTTISLSTITDALTNRFLSAPARPATPATRAPRSDNDLTFDAVIESDDALRTYLQLTNDRGFATLRGFHGDMEGAETLARRIGYPRETIFGGMWSVSAENNDHDDTAYSTTYLGPHTDGTYSHDAPGLQTFCFAERDGTGGESIVVDGIAIAEQIQTERPDLFETLTTVSVPAHYIEPGVELRAARPPIRLDQNGTVVQVSMNNYDRSPFLLEPDAMAKFYEAYGELHRRVNDRDQWTLVDCQAGDVLMIDNWRTLHGRMAYTGERRFVGCYHNHEDFESRCRLLGIH